MFVMVCRFMTMKVALLKTVVSFCSKSILHVTRGLGVRFGAEYILKSLTVLDRRIQTTAKPCCSGTCHPASVFIADPDGRINHIDIRCVVCRHRPVLPYTASDAPTSCSSGLPAGRFWPEVARWSCTRTSCRIHCGGLRRWSLQWRRFFESTSCLMYTMTVIRKYSVAEAVSLARFMPKYMSYLHMHNSNSN